MKKFYSSTSKEIVREGVKALKNAMELNSNHVYDKTHNILVVGEDNFHFSKKLKEVVGSSDSIYATSANPSASKEVKSIGASMNKAELTHAFYNTNPMEIGNSKELRGEEKDRIYDRVVYYEPKDSVAFEKFLGYCRDFISEQGQVHIFFSSKGPQTNWELERMAAEHGYVLNRGMKVPWDGKKKDHHYTVLPFTRDPNFKKKKHYSYPDQEVDWEAVAHKQQAEAAAASAGGSGGDDDDDEDV